MNTKIILNSNIDLSHIAEAIKFCNKLELKEGRLSTVTYSYPKFEVTYRVWHNKASFRLSSHNSVL